MALGHTYKVAIATCGRTGKYTSHHGSLESLQALCSIAKHHAQNKNVWHRYARRLFFKSKWRILAYVRILRLMHIHSIANRSAEGQNSCRRAVHVPYKTANTTHDSQVSSESRCFLHQQFQAALVSLGVVVTNFQEETSNSGVAASTMIATEKIIYVWIYTAIHEIVNTEFRHGHW